MEGGILEGGWFRLGLDPGPPSCDGKHVLEGLCARAGEGCFLEEPGRTEQGSGWEEMSLFSQPETRMILKEQISLVFVQVSLLCRSPACRYLHPGGHRHGKGTKRKMRNPICAT